MGGAARPASAVGLACRAGAATSAWIKAGASFARAATARARATASAWAATRTRAATSA